MRVPVDARFDAASLTCASALPVETLESSRGLPWTSLLLDHQRLLTSDGEFETSATTDETVVVMTKGLQELDAFRKGRWKRSVYRPGSIGLTPSGEVDRLRRRVRPDGGPACKINIYLPLALFDEAADHLGPTGSLSNLRSTAVSAYRDDALRTAAITLLRAVRSGAPALYADCMAHWLVVHILTSRHGRDDDEPPVPASADERIVKVLEFMAHHHAQNLSLDRLALEASVSKFHFTRLFRRATGVTPHRWLVEARLHAGRRLLTTTDASVAEIAARCGFTRANHFATLFVRKFGVAPSVFRRRA